MHIGNRLNAHGGEDFNESERQSIGRDLAHTLAKPRALAQGIEHLFREDRLETTRRVAELLVYHWALPHQIIHLMVDPIEGTPRSSHYLSKSLKILPMSNRYHFTFLRG